MSNSSKHSNLPPIYYRMGGEFMRIRLIRRFPILFLFNQTRFRGRRFVWRGNRALRNLGNLYRNDIESLRFISPSGRATLVLFSEPNFRGRFRVFRGTTNIPNLNGFIAGQDPESLIISSRRLSIIEIRRIRRTGILPRGFRVR